MKTQVLHWCWLAVASLAVGQAEAWAADEPVTDPNRVGLNFRLGFNVGVRFENLGGHAWTGAAGPATGGATNRDYEDGFVRVDGSGNEGGLTWNWGYRDPGQIVDDHVLLRARAAEATGSVESDDEPYPGMELAFGRALGRFAGGRWGLEAALGLLSIDTRNSQSLAGDVHLLTDRYALGGVVPPVHPYAGSVEGPGVLIGDTPSRTMEILPDAALTTGYRELEAELYSLRLGPFVEWTLVGPLSAEVGVGVALAVVDSRFEFSEAVSLQGGVEASQTGADDQSEFLAGVYAGGQLTCRLYRGLALTAGVQFQYLGEFDQETQGKRAELDLGQTWFCTFGLRYAW